MVWVPLTKKLNVIQQMTGSSIFGHLRCLLERSKLFLCDLTNKVCYSYHISHTSVWKLPLKFAINRRRPVKYVIKFEKCPELFYFELTMHIFSFFNNLLLSLHKHQTL